MNNVFFAVSRVSHSLNRFVILSGNSPYHNTADEEEDGEKRNFIYDLYTSSYAQKKAAFSMNIPSNAAKHPLVRNGHVRPVFLQPLYKEIDEREFGGRVQLIVKLK